MTDLIKSTLLDARSSFATAYSGDKEAANKYALGVYNTVILNDKLMECDAASIRDAAITSAVLGVPIDARQYAYLIPYGKQVQFQMSYKGYIYVAKRDSDVDNIISNIVYEDDTFSVDLGANTLSHIPKLDSPTYGKTESIKYVYSLVRFRSNTGRAMMFEVLTKKQVDDIRAISKAGGDKDKWGKPTIWALHYGEMARKTAIKRLCKHAQLGDVARIDEIDNGIERGQIINVTPEGELKVDDELRNERDRMLILIDKTETQEQLDEFYLINSKTIEELAANNMTSEITKKTKNKKEALYMEKVIDLLDACEEVDGLEKVYKNHEERINQLRAAVRNDITEHYCELKQAFTSRQNA